MTKYIELIPWVHSLQSQEHEDIINYIKQLPKGAVLLVEGSYQDYLLYHTIIDLVLGRKINISGFTTYYKEMVKKLSSINNLSLSDIAEYVSPGTLAALDLIMECFKYNVKLIPIEMEVYRSKVMKIRTKLEDLDYTDLTKLDILRETGGIRNLRAFENVVQPLYMLSGASHTSFNVKLLRENGFNAQINLDIFTEPKHIERIIKDARNSRRLFLNGYVEDAEDLTLLKNSGIVRRFKDYDVALLRLKSKLKKYANKQITRFERRRLRAGKNRKA